MIFHINYFTLLKSSCQFKMMKNHEFNFLFANFLCSKPPEDKKSKLNLAKPKKLSERFKKAMEEKKTNKDLTIDAIEKLAALSINKKPSMKSDLLKKLEEHSASKKSKTGLSFDSLFNNMRIEEPKSRRAHSTPIKYDSDNRILKYSNIYTGPDLEIFDPPSSTVKRKVSTLYAYLKEEENLKLITMPPNNAFEETINWTRDGKLWNFPIDNEQGLPEYEWKTGFHEHVYFTEYANRFPNKRPIRIFMDLVFNGLAHNPYISVKEKKESIEWYVSYFNEHGDLIPEDQIS